jgi:hypothetical protein
MSCILMVFSVGHIETELQHNMEKTQVQAHIRDVMEK